MPMCKTVDHCYEGGSKTVVDRYHSGNNLGTGPVLFQYFNVYWESIQFSPGKLPFYRNRIARKFLTPQCITMMSPDEHTKSPKKSEVGKYG